jgi:hypothetical protein
MSDIRPPIAFNHADDFGCDFPLRSTCFGQDPLFARLDDTLYFLFSSFVVCALIPRHIFLIDNRLRGPTPFGLWEDFDGNDIPVHGTVDVFSSDEEEGFSACGVRDGCFKEVVGGDGDCARVECAGLETCLDPCARVILPVSTEGRMGDLGEELFRAFCGGFFEGFCSGDHVEKDLCIL